MKPALRILLVATLVAGQADASTGMLYKAIGPNGTVIFSDTPPEGEARIVEQRALPSLGQPSRTFTAAADTAQLLDGDQEVARANEKVDLAEHALALARRDFGATHDTLGLKPVRMSASGAERVEFYKKNLRVARQYLAELVRERQSQPARIMVSMNP